MAIIKPIYSGGTQQTSVSTGGNASPGIIKPLYGAGNNYQYTPPKPVSQPRQPVSTPLPKRQPDLLDKTIGLVNKIPVAHFADNAKWYTPIGFLAQTAQATLNAPGNFLKAAESLGHNIGAKTSTNQQVGADIADLVTFPLLLLGGADMVGGAKTLVTGGIKAIAGQGFKGAATQGIKAIGQNIVKKGVGGAAKTAVGATVGGAAFGGLTGLQSGRNISNASDWVKNFLENVKGGVEGGLAFGALHHIVVPLAPHATPDKGAVFAAVKNDKPTIEHVQLAPEIAQSTVINNHLAETPVGKEILKQSIVAQKTEQHVTITPSPHGKFTLPTGEKVDIGVAPIYDPANHEAVGAGVSEAGTKEPLYRISAGGTGLPDSVVADTVPLSSTDTTNVSPSKVYKPGVTVKDVLGDEEFINHYNNTTEREGSLQAVLKDVAGNRQTIIGKKDMRTAAEKIVSKANRSDNGYPLEKIHDLLRSRVIARDAADKATILDSLKKRADVVRVKEHTYEENPWGYSGINAVIRTPEGHLNEVQILTPEELYVDKQLHSFYEEHRREMNTTKDTYNESRQIAEKARAEFQMMHGNKSAKEAVKATETAQSTDTVGIQGDTPIGTGRPKPSRLQERIQEELLSLDSGKYEFDKETGNHNTLNLKKDAENALKLLEEDPNKALRVAKGYEKAPEGLSDNGVALAVAFKARDEGNYKLFTDIINRTSLRATRIGQEIVVLRGKFGDNTPQNFIKQVLNTRLERLGKNIVSTANEVVGKMKQSGESAREVAMKRIDQEAAKIQKIIAKDRVKIDTATKFINDLICK